MQLTVFRSRNTIFVRSLRAVLVFIGASLVISLAQAGTDATGWKIQKLTYVYNEITCVKGGSECPLHQNIIYVVDKPGSSPHELAVGIAPTWSPDGSRIAYCQQASPSGLSQIVTVSSDGTDSRQLTHNTEGACEPAWSPNGKLIAYSASGSIFVVGVDGNHAVLVGSGRSPTWSPDGKQIVYETGKIYQANGGIYVVNADGGNAMKVASGRFQHWSPDGKQLLFIRARAEHRACSMWANAGANCDRHQGSIWTTNANGTEQHMVYAMKERPKGGFRAFWSPDGKSIVMPLQDGRSTKMFRVNLDGAGLDKISDQPMQEMYVTELSPDGQQFVAIHDRLSLGQTDGQLDEPTVVLIDAKYKSKLIGVGTAPSIFWQHN